MTLTSGGSRTAPSLSLWPFLWQRWWFRCLVRVIRGAIDTRVPQEQTISVRWILRVLRALPLTPWWVRARRRRNRREMLAHLRRYYANGQ